MNKPSPSGFKVGLVQMRSGVDPQANLAIALAAIEEAARAGAGYVLTPEMTNIMEVKRDRLFTTIVDEEIDPTLTALREAARKHSIYVNIGSLAVKVSPDKAANRSFLIDRRGEVIARYDKIHMFDVDLANGESYRESRNYRPGDLAVIADLPWGRLGLTVCYDLRFPALYRALAEPAHRSFLFPPPSPGGPVKCIGPCFSVRVRSRTAHSCSPPRRAASTKMGAKPTGIRWSSTRGARFWPKVTPSPGIVLADIDPAQVTAARSRIPSLLHGRRFEVIEPMAEPTHLRAVQGRHDPLRPALRQRPRFRKLVRQLGCL